MTNLVTECAEALIFANDRPTSTGDDLYQWAIDAEDLIRSLVARILELDDLNTQLCEQQDVLSDAYSELKRNIRLCLLQSNTTQEEE